MPFQLVTKQKEITINFVPNPTEEQLVKYEQEGLSKIAYDGGYFFVNMNDEYMQEKLKSALGVPHYELFLETTGLRNWVLYNPKYYRKEYNREDKFILRFNYSEYDGSPIESPINASSLCSMFSWMQLPENITFHPKFDTKNVVDMSALFAGAVFPKNFNLNVFDFSSLLWSRYMFFGTTIKNPNFFQSLQTDTIKNAEYMFAETKFCENVNLDLYMPECRNMNCMFFDARFNKNCNLGDDFYIPNHISALYMFQDATLDDINLSNYSYDYVLHQLNKNN